MESNQVTWDRRKLHYMLQNKSTLINQITNMAGVPLKLSVLEKIGYSPGDLAA
jgi:hypothetical protein